jgi:hypothetical protein
MDVSGFAALSTSEAVREMVIAGKAGAFPAVPTDAQRRALGQNLLEVWGELATNPDSLPTAMELSGYTREGKAEVVGGDDLRAVGIAHALLWIGELGILEDEGDIAWLSAPARRYLSYSNGAVTESWLFRFTLSYWVFAVTRIGLPTMQKLAEVEPFASAAFNDYAHRSLVALDALQSELKGGSEYVQVLADLGLTSALRSLAGLYRETAYREREVSPRRGLTGPFSLIRPDELPRLATRENEMARRYGKKGIERVFENQLSLVVQSLGFIVARARSGERKVDLLCIAARSPDPVTFLIEAKTSGRAYGLPTKDERALAEYVRTVRRTLETLPPLQFVLLVGPSPAASLAKRLRDFAATNAIAIAFMSASDLRLLREGLPGPVRPSEFVDGVLASAPVVGTEAVNTIIERQRAFEAGHTELIRQMLQPFDLPGADV